MNDKALLLTMFVLPGAIIVLAMMAYIFFEPITSFCTSLIAGAEEGGEK